VLARKRLRNVDAGEVTVNLRLKTKRLKAIRRANPKSKWIQAQVTTKVTPPAGMGKPVVTKERSRIALRPLKPKRKRGRL
jgi:hypothetical protein